MKQTLGLQQGGKEASEAGGAKGLPPSSFLELGAGRPRAAPPGFVPGKGQQLPCTCSLDGRGLCDRLK